MKKRILSFGLVICALGLIGAGSCKNTDTGSMELTVFHTNDLHSHFRAAKSDPFGLGGLARVSTLLKKLRLATPQSVTLDAGDYSEGTFYFTLNTGANMLKAMGMMGYDAAALGNHDFLMGPDQLIRTMKDSGTPFPVLAANLEMSNYPRASELQPLIPAITVKQVGGLKVGVIGLTTFEMLYDSYIAPVKIINPLDIATKYAKLLRPDVDVMILLSHNSFDTNVFLAKAIPGIDAVVSGHSHRKVPKAVLVKNAGRDVPVVETGQWGTFLGDLKFTVAPEGKGVQYKSYQLHPVTPDLAEDPALARFIDEQDQELNAKYHDDVNRVVAESELDLIQTEGKESPLGNLAVKAYLASTHADVALEEISLTGVSVAKGPATLMDLHDVVPHVYDTATNKEWMLRVWNAKGSDLQLIINVFYMVEGLMPLGSPLGWLSAENAVITWDPGISRISFEKLADDTRRGRASFARSMSIPAVKSILIGGKPLDPNARYKVAIADGFLLAITLANEKLHLGVDLSDITNTGIEAWQSVVNYASGARKLTVEDLGVGGRTHTKTPDLAIFYYAMDWDGSKLSLEVQNLGLTDAPAGNMTCSTGLPNDFVAFHTSSQVWKKIGSLNVPALAAGGHVSVQMPWSGSRLVAGYWPVECVVTNGSDKYEPNNSAQKVFRVTGR